MDPSVLTLNAGSSSIKFQSFSIADGAPRRLFKGQIEGIGASPRLSAKDAEDRILVERSMSGADAADLPAAMEILSGWLGEHLAGRMPAAIGHRVVHGGPDFDRPVLIDETVLNGLERLATLAPLHQPNNLAPIRAVRRRMPDLPQVACFDTAFHRTHDELVDRYAIPQWLWDEGVRRYGFHGLSYEYIAEAMTDLAPDEAGGRVVAAHLGSGASLCAMQDGRSVDSTMGFSALDGLPMGTRPGQIDPGVILHLIAQRRMSPSEVEHLLYHECGLKGLSGISNDVRDLQASDDPRARMALDVFAFRTAREVGALATVLGGLDALVFTAGIGERSSEVRRSVCNRLAWLGVTLDDDANRQDATRISRPGAGPAVYVIPTDEERMIARHTLQVLQTGTTARSTSSRHMALERG